MLLSHIKSVHACEPGFTVQCDLQRCKRTFKIFSTFRNHVYNFHDLVAAAPYTNSNVEDMDQEVITPIAVASGNMDSDTSLRDNDLDQEDGTPNADCVISEEILQRSAALWILKTRDPHRIPQSVMDGMVSDLGSLFQCALAGISSKVQCTLKDGGAIDNLLRSVLGHLDVGTPFSDIFKGLKTHHEQLKYFKEKFDLVVSSICLLIKRIFVINGN